MLTATGLNFGVRRGLPHLAGVCVGFPVMLALIGMGLGGLFELYPLLHQAIKLVGVIYLVYLAIKIASARGGGDGVKPVRPIGFWQAAAFQWVNAKAWIMGSSALAAYTSIGGDFFWQVGIISVSFLIITFPCAGIWLVFGASLQRFMQSPRHFRWFNIVMALLLLASILPVLAELLALFTGTTQASAGYRQVMLVG